VPIALNGVFDLLPIHAHHFYPGELTLTVGEPIETTGMTPRQTDALTAQLRDAIESLRRPESSAAHDSVEQAAVRVEV